MTTDTLEFPALKEAQGKLDAKRKSLADLLAEAGPDYDMTKVKSIQGDTHAKVAEIAKMNAEIDEAKAAVTNLVTLHKAAQNSRDDSGSREGGADSDMDTRGRKGFGQLVMGSEAIKGYKAGSGSGPVARIDVGLKTLFETGAGWDPEDLRTGRVEMYPTRPAPRVIDAFPQTTTTMSTVLYMEETTFTNNAAETSEGAAYGEAQLALTERSSEVRKVAVFLPVTDEQFEDEPRARSYVENRLPFMLKQRLDLQLLTGNGTSPNLRGTENVSGINTQALGVDPLADALYKAMRAVRETGFAEPSHVFIRPSKWEQVRLARTADGIYIWGHPSMPGPMTIWGVPVVETTAVTSTKAVLGDYTNFSEVSVRRGIDIQISNSHGSFFIEGKLAIRADVRCAAIHYRPTAFAVVTGL
ncbi:phage capsid protein [Rhizocola hellebori]|uniref:Phage capsid protein n=1 Tax=Rhizocola hellebori TaxID=1392758 RepID=A0A8J3QAU4_9ACTN|nr:phage major capsid protein [Rhizocola hellebori]GIH07413.1 phage capsid protein [Rhizocola hellebori]